MLAFFFLLSALRHLSCCMSGSWKKVLVGWFHVSQRKHVIDFILSGWGKQGRKSGGNPPQIVLHNSVVLPMLTTTLANEHPFQCANGIGTSRKPKLQVDYFIKRQKDKTSLEHNVFEVSPLSYYIKRLIRLMRFDVMSKCVMKTQLLFY